MNTSISVIIPTHNPNQNRLERTLQGLRSQTLAGHSWELLVVDNATSDLSYVPSFDLSWHPHARLIREERLGLTRARLAGIAASQGECLIFVDDDNVLSPDYLQHVLDIFAAYPQLGAIGGKSLPEFEVNPQPWVKEFWGCLALRDLGDTVQTYSYSQDSRSNKEHPLYAPIGAGMAVRRSAIQCYVERILNNPQEMILDRTGKSLQSGGDCDINLTLLDAGWGVGYFPQLQLTHLIPSDRTTRDYLARLNHGITRSWVQVLDTHGIRPWQKITRWSVLPRQIKAIFNYQPWKSDAAYVSWQAACGLFEGLSMLAD